MKTFAIDTRALTKRYRKTLALDSVSVRVPKGAVYALVGANGAGKTTLIRLLMNIFQPTNGNATVLGVPVSELSGRAFEQIGYVSENQDTLNMLTIAGLLNYVRPFYPQWDRLLEAHLIKQFDLPLNRRLRHLSRGMKMKAALASVLAYRPALVVLDEPFSGLDPLVRDELIEGLKERAPDSTIFLSSHDMAEVESLATHVGFLQQGELLFSEDISTLTARFREIEVDISKLGTVEVPPNTPAAWLYTHKSQTSFRFTDSQFSEATRSYLSELFPNAAVSVKAMTLREIFVAIARAGRAQKMTSPPEEAA